MRRVLLTLIVVLFTPSLVFAEGTADLGFRNNSDIFFSTDTLISGQTVRVYARVRNNGTSDVSGYVSFVQGTIPIGDSQVISVRAGGADEEVYVDFTIPEGSFNIRAEIKGTDPVDQNSSNDVVLSNLFTPTHDDDADGVANDSDNCSSASNANQLDTDSDGMGDACDTDDDADTLSDTLEQEMGLNPLSADTDGDGVTDPNDYAPTDPSVAVAPPAPAADPAPTTVDVTTVTPETLAPDDPLSATTAPQQEASAPTTTEENTTDNNGAAPSDLQISPNAIFSYEQNAWNIYTFSVRGFEGEGYRYSWDFGDGVTSNRTVIEHTYRASGDYHVALSVTDSKGASATDQATVSVSFFHVENPALQLLLALLAVLFLTSVGIYIRILRHKRDVDV